MSRVRTTALVVLFSMWGALCSPLFAGSGYDRVKKNAEDAFSELDRETEPVEKKAPVKKKKQKDLQFPHPTWAEE